jgi:hypothetical protein
MEQKNDVARRRINAAEVGTFVEIAAAACPAEVLGIIAAAMLARDDVL